jgi:hypothetical protein
MLRSPVRRRYVRILIVSAGLFGYAPIAAQQPNEYDRTLARVLRLLPRPPDTIVVVDADTSGRSLHRSLQHVEGFVIHGERVVRLVRQGETLQRAMKGGGIFDYALAIIVWHEMAHIDGADEAAARRADEQLWAEFVRASASTASAVSNI